MTVGFKDQFIRHMTFVYNRTGAAVRLMDGTAKRAQLLLLVALLAHLAREAECVTTCCARGCGSCKLYELLCRAGRRNDTYVAGHFGRLNNDAAATGILTFGKRKVFERRLQHLLQRSRNQAAGKRFEDDGHAEGTASSPVSLSLERPLKYLMPTVREETAYVDAYETR